MREPNDADVENRSESIVTVCLKCGTVEEPDYAPEPDDPIRPKVVTCGECRYS